MNFTVLRMDFQNLISCIQCHDDSKNSEVILETLRTVIDICSNESCGKDAFRQEGGLDFLMEFLTNTDSTILLEYSLKTLASVINENIHSQMYMTTQSVFEVIQAILRKETFCCSIYKNALFLISTILYQNNAAQILLCETGILQDLLNMYNSTSSSLSTVCGYAVSSLENSSNELWLSLNSVLCFAVNNPQNENNQEICSILFTPILRILGTSENNTTISSVCSFLSLCISNNVRNQDSFAECDGLLTLKRCFQKYFDRLLLEAKDCFIVVRKGTLQTLSNIVAIFSAVASNHEKNADILGKLGVLSLMVKLLFVDLPDVQLITRLILSLGHCVDACCSNKSYILETENFDVLLKKNLDMDNEELASACKYLLQACLLEEGYENTELGLNDELAVLFDKRNIADFSSMKSVTDNQLLQIGPTDLQSSQFGNKYISSNSFIKSELNHHFDNQFELKSQEGFHRKRAKDCLTKRSSSVFSKAEKNYSHQLHPTCSYPNRKQLSSTSVQKPKTIIDCQPSIGKTPKQESQFCGFSSKSNTSKKRTLVDVSKKNVKMLCTQGFDRAQALTSTADPHAESVFFQKAPKCFMDFCDNIRELNKSLNQSFCIVSDSERENRPYLESHIRNVPYASDESIMDSFKFPKRSVLSDRTNMETPFQKDSHGTEKSFFIHPNTSLKKDGSVFSLKLVPAPNKSSLSQSSFPFPNEKRLKDLDSQSSITSCYEGPRKSLQQLRQLKNSNTEHSKTFNDFRRDRDTLDKPRLFGSQSSNENSQRQSNSFTRIKGMNLDETFDSSNYMKVLVFPGKTCESHGLISSFEMLKVVSIDDEEML